MTDRQTDRQTGLAHSLLRQTRVHHPFLVFCSDSSYSLIVVPPIPSTDLTYLVLQCTLYEYIVLRTSINSWSGWTRVAIVDRHCNFIID